MHRQLLGFTFIAMVLALAPPVTGDGSVSASTAYGPLTTPTPSPSPVPRITLTPTTGFPGAPVSIDGSGFTPGDSVAVYIDSKDDNRGYGPPVGPDGTVSLAIFIGWIDVGTHSICVQTSVVVCAPFTVINFQPTIKLSPDSGPPSVALTIVGKGFPPSEVVALYVDAPDVLLGTPGPNSDVAGGFTTTAVILSRLPGLHQICADTGAPDAPNQQYSVKTCALFKVNGLDLASPSPILPASPSPTQVATDSTAQGSPSPPVLPIAGGVALVVALGAGAFFWARRRRKSPQEG